MDIQWEDIGQGFSKAIVEDRIFRWSSPDRSLWEVTSDKRPLHGPARSMGNYTIVDEFDGIKTEEQASLAVRDFLIKATSPEGT